MHPGGRDHKTVGATEAAESSTSEFANTARLSSAQGQGG